MRPLWLWLIWCVGLATFLVAEGRADAAPGCRCGRHKDRAAAERPATTCSVRIAVQTYQGRQSVDAGKGRGRRHSQNQEDVLDLAFLNIAPHPIAQFARVLEEESRDILGVDIVAYLLSLVAVDRVRLSSERTFHEIREKAVKFST